MSYRNSTTVITYYFIVKYGHERQNEFQREPGYTSLFKKGVLQDGGIPSNLCFEGSEHEVGVRVVQEAALFVVVLPLLLLLLQKVGKVPSAALLRVML